eukprot:309078-Prorocentrum_lima.AAC.1
MNCTATYRVYSASDDGSIAKRKRVHFCTWDNQIFCIKSLHIRAFPIGAYKKRDILEWDTAEA